MFYHVRRRWVAWLNGPASQPGRNPGWIIRLANLSSQLIQLAQASALNISHA
jgi:hypothetical protein